jgi:hypothetical protein
MKDSIVTFLIIALVALLFFSGSFTSNKSRYAGPTKWVVYGTMSCGWTRKQIDELKANKVAYEFVDCSVDGACPGMNAYPVNKKPDGTQVVGFTSAS